MFKVGTMLKAREVRLSRKKPPYHPALIPGTIAIDLGRAVLDSRGHLQFFYFEEVIFGKWFHVVVKPNIACSGLWISSFHMTKPSEVARHTKSGKVLRAYNARGVLQHLPEHRLQLARRAADDFKNL